MSPLERFRFLLAFRHRGSAADAAADAGVDEELARWQLEVDPELAKARAAITLRYFRRLAAGLGYLNG